jgi:hypothetical protein
MICKRLQWVKLVACMRETRNTYSILEEEASLHMSNWKAPEDDSWITTLKDFK